MILNLFYLIMFSWWLTNNTIIQNIISKIPIIRLIFSCCKCTSGVIAALYLIYTTTEFNLDSTIQIIGLTACCSFAGMLIQFIYDVIPIKLN